VKIVSTEARCYRVPLPAPWGSATHRITHHELIITRVATDAKLGGVGWAYTIGTGGTGVTALLTDYLLPMIDGRDPAPIGRIWHELWQGTHDAAGGIARLALASLDIALWDLAARAAARPLAEVLGGRVQAVVAYGSGVNLHLPLPELRAQVEGWQRREYQAFKMKVGSDDPEADVERVRAVREQIGPRARLMVDANQKWTAAEAVRRVGMLEPFAPHWIEEPVLADDVPGNAWVKAHVPLPVALGENVHSTYQFAEYMRQSAVDIVQPDVARVGGITEWMKIAHLAGSHNLLVSGHLMAEISCHLHCAVSNATVLEDVDGGSLTDLGVLRTPLRAERGCLTPPSVPGHGVEFDWDALRRYEVRPGAGAPAAASRPARA
jgi:L-alanine-DL-glutamate epimerase-like enolase superfamily enzyme